MFGFLILISCILFVVFIFKKINFEKISFQPVNNNSEKKLNKLKYDNEVNRSIIKEKRQKRLIKNGGLKGYGKKK